MHSTWREASSGLLGILYRDIRRDGRPACRPFNKELLVEMAELVAAAGL